jgi:hypothetical protein
VNIHDLSLPKLEQLHGEALLPVGRLFEQLADARRLASSTRESIHAESLMPQHREHFLLSAVERQVLPRYRSILDTYREHRADFQSLCPHDAVALESEFELAIRSPTAELFDHDTPAISLFGRDVARVLQQLSSRLRELTY